MHTDRSARNAGGQPLDALEEPFWTASILLITDSVGESPLQQVLEWARSSGCATSVVADVDAAFERLSQASFTVILLDADLCTGLGLKRLREQSAGSTLIIRGGSSAAGADRWIALEDSAAAIIGCLRDAVERAQLLAQLEASRVALDESEGRFRSIIGRTADGIVILGPNGRVMFANGGAERMFARPAADLVGRDFGVPLVSGETAEMDIVRTPNSDAIVAELGVSATTWEGMPAQIISLRDITERKHAQQRNNRLLLEQSGREQAEDEVRRARLLADASAALDASLNAESTLAVLAGLVVPRVGDWCVIDLLEGDQVRRIAGNHSDPARQTLVEDLTERYLPLIGTAQPCSRVLTSGATELHVGLDPAGLLELAVDQGHADLLGRLGTRSIMSIPMEARDQCIGAITFGCAERDFDEADVNLAVEIASRAAHAIENSRLFESSLIANRVKSDFLAVMSHELRTPLTAILGYADLMLGGVAGDMNTNQTKYINRIRAGGTKLLEILQEILMYAEMEAGRAQARPREISVAALLDEVIAIAKPLAEEKGLEFRLKVEHRDAALYTDVGKLRQILLNVLANAVKFTDTGSVELCVSVVESELTVVVTDTGIGIEDEELEEIFEPFRQVEQGRTRRAGGTGLGLSVSRQLAELLDGDLSVESRIGAGSVFRLTIPVGAAQRDAAAG